MIRTMANEEAMPDVAWDTHPTPEQIAELLFAWMNAKQRPINGSMAKLKLSGGVCVGEFL